MKDAAELLFDSAVFAVAFAIHPRAQLRAIIANSGPNGPTRGLAMLVLSAGVLTYIIVLAGVLAPRAGPAAFSQPLRRA